MIDNAEPIEKWPNTIGKYYCISDIDTSYINFFWVLLFYYGTWTVFQFFLTVLKVIYDAFPSGPQAAGIETDLSSLF